MNKYFGDLSEHGMRGIGTIRPQLFGAFLALADQVMSSPSRLTPLQREVLGAYLSRQFGCDFCHLGHLDTVEAIAGPDARNLVESPTPEYAALFRFADAVAANAVTEGAFDDLMQSGFDESAAQDVVFVAALFGFANRMVTGFDIHYRADRDRESSMALAKGYNFRPGR